MKRFLLLCAASWIFCNIAWISSQGMAEEASAPSRSHLKQEILASASDLTLVGDVYEGFLEHRRSVRVPIPIEKPGCYRVAAVGENSVEDISLALYQSNVEKARDRLSGKRPVVDWCAPEGGSIEAEVSMFTGSGGFVLAAFEKKDLKTAKGTKKVGGDDKDFVANRIRQLHSRFGKGRSAATEVLRGNLSQGNEQSFPIQIAGKCIAIIAAQDPSLLELDISLSNSSQNLSTMRRNTSSFLLVETEPCLKTGGEFRVTVRAVRGSGRFGFQVFSD